MVLSRLFHRINLSISAAVLSLATVMPGEAAAITLDFTEYAGNFGIYGGIDATFDITVNSGQATFTFTNNSDGLAISRIYMWKKPRRYGVCGRKVSARAPSYKRILG
jgi:hypothetical protein